MTLYNIILPVTRATGWQLFHVIAKSKDEALEKFETGIDLEFIEEGFEIYTSGEPEIEVSE